MTAENSSFHAGGTCTTVSVSEMKLRLHRLLRPRAVPLQHYVDSRIPANLKSRIAGEDILQEVWMAAFQSIRSVLELPEDELDRWLYRVADRRLVSTIRFHTNQKRGAGREAMSRDLTTSLVQIYERLGSPQRTPSSLAAQNELAAGVKLAIDRLPEESRQVICMHHIEGLDALEISRRLNKTTGAVRGLLYRGMLQLSRILNPQSGNDHTT